MQNLGVVREYNAIITSVAGERRLFTDRLRHLDRRVNSGVNKLSWNMDRSALEFYQKEARKFCREGTASVGRFKSGVEAVRAACARIAELMLVDLERKGVVQVRCRDSECIIWCAALWLKFQPCCVGTLRG